MKKTIPLLTFEAEGENKMKEIDKVRDTYKKVLDIMSEKIEEKEIMKMFNYIMKEYPDIFVKAFESLGKVLSNTIYDVRLDCIGELKIQIIKEVRAITGFGLKEAKDLVERAPEMVIQNVNNELAKTYKDQLERQGAIVTLIPKN